MGSKVLFCIILQIIILSEVRAENCWYRDRGSNHIEIQCPRILEANKGFSMSILDSRISIECFNGFHSSFGEVKNFKLPRSNKALTLQGCPLPEKKFKDLFQSLGVNETSSIEFLGDDTYPKLADKLKGLDYLEQLSLTLVTIGYLDYLPKLHTLEIRRSRMNLSSHFFENLPDLKSLSVTADNFSKIPDSTFQSMPNLTQLSLKGYNLRKLNHKIFENLSNMQQLYLTNNNIQTIDPEAFKNLSNISLISLFYNNLTTVPSNLFKYNNNLQQLILSGNNLGSFPEFPTKMPKMKMLDLSNCRLHHLEENLLKNLPNLEEIFLEDNNLETLPKNFFQNATKLKEISLSNNQIPDIGNTFQSLTNLKKLNFDWNQIKHLNKSHFSDLINLEEVHLAFNSISLVYDETFINSNNLKIIDMSNNHLTNPALEIILKNKSKLTRIDFGYNKIRHLNLLLLHDLGNRSLEIILESNEIEKIDVTSYDLVKHKHVYILLDSNPIPCDCFNLDFFKLVRSHKNPLEFAGIGSLKCRSLNFDEFKCGIPEELGCPAECVSCDWVPYRKSIVFNCSNANLTHYPAINTSLIEYPFNSTMVHLENNKLTEGPSDIASYFNITELYLENNQINKIEWIPKALKVLHLQNNQINYLDSSILKKLEASLVEELTLHGNSWVCDCDAKSLLNFLTNSSHMVKPKDVKCTYNNLELISLSETDLCSLKNITVYLSIGLLVLLSLISFATICHLYLKKKLRIWLFGHGLFLSCITEDEIDKDKLFDVFISYSSKDQKFVEETLVPTLETYKYTVNVHYKDWMPGELITSQIVKSVDDSKRTLIVLSPNYVESCWGTYEFQVAYAKALKGNQLRLIVVLYENTSLDGLDNDLKQFLKSTTYLKWGEKQFWNKLRYALPHNKETKEEIV